MSPGEEVFSQSYAEARGKFLEAARVAALEQSREFFDRGVAGISSS